MWASGEEWQLMSLHYVYKSYFPDTLRIYLDARRANLTRRALFVGGGGGISNSRDTSKE